MDLYRPGDTWPIHQKPPYHTPLEYAQGAGWYLQKFDGHTWGKLVCKEDAPEEERCEIRISRTAKGGESFALGIRSKIDGCPHREQTRPPSRFDRLSQASERLGEAERLIEAARLCIESRSKLVGADELLQRATEAADAADEVLGEEAALLDEAGALEDEAETDHQEAASIAGSAGYPPDAPVAASPLLDEATNRVREASTGVRGRADRNSTKLNQRIQAARETITFLRAQLPS